MQKSGSENLNATRFARCLYAESRNINGLLFANKSAGNLGKKIVQFAQLRFRLRSSTPGRAVLIRRGGRSVRGSDTLRCSNAET